MKPTEKHQPLYPTLWRTCRVLANETRLRCFRNVLKSPGITVELVAKAVRIRECEACVSLRALQSRGLIAALRKSRWVMYYPEPDKSVVSAEDFLLAVKSAIFDQKLSDPQLFKVLTAYTHPRRIEIVRTLASSDAIGPTELSYKADISLPALFRHLDKLEKRGVVVSNNGKYSLADPTAGFARDIFLLVLK